ncbi:MAG: cation diffusion facilitator family transporter [Bacillota bacterium]|nr:cation diffusion facilitator family transporter [Bacillota bacterium]
MERSKTASRISWITLVANLILTILKAIIGITTGSLVVLSDAAHSASDAFSTLLVLLGIHIAKQPPDEKHPYGHGRAETIVTKIIALMLIVVGLNFAYTAFKAIWQGSARSPGISALWISVVSIIAKEIMYQYTYKVGKEIDSTALVADAWHHRSDAISSVAALLGVFAARLGYPIFDPLMTFIVAFILIKVGWNMTFTVIDELMDAQVEDQVLEEIEEIILSISGVCTLKNLKVHKYGADHHVDCTITVPSHYDVAEGHDLSHQVEDKIRDEFITINHVDIHIEPHYSSEQDSDY